MSEQATTIAELTAELGIAHRELLSAQATVRTAEDRVWRLTEQLGELLRAGAQ